MRGMPNHRRGLWVQRHVYGVIKQLYQQHGLNMKQKPDAEQNER